MEKNIRLLASLFLVTGLFIIPVSGFHVDDSHSTYPG